MSIAFEFAMLMVLMNFIALFYIWLDKRRAIHGKDRISETKLLWLAAMGGSIGTMIGRSLFRHKTRKQPFSNQLTMITALHLGALIFAAALWYGR